jgi:hypothetical protein
MRIFILTACCLLTLSGFGQSVNEKITLKLVQTTLLRVSVGENLNLTESGSAIIGESMFVNGGTADFSYSWLDEQKMEYFEQTPEVTSSGKYVLTVSDQNNCTALDSLRVNDYGTGITKHNADLNILVRLDSQNELLMIETSKALRNVRLKIVSIEGRVLYSYAQALANAPFMHTVGVSSIKGGIYLIDLQSEEGYFIKKIVLP